LACLNDLGPDVILLDVMMPDQFILNRSPS